MRDRVLEFLPLLLVVLMLASYQLVRTGAGEQMVGMLPLVATPVPSPTVAVAGARALAPATTPTPVPAAAVGCASGRPRFVGGLALLRAAVGSQMGDPLDCEHVIDGQGNTEQRTSTGLAYYLKAPNAPCFTTGYDHWSLARDGSLVHWTGDAVDPPD